MAVCFLKIERIMKMANNKTTAKAKTNNVEPMNEVVTTQPETTVVEETNAVAEVTPTVETKPEPPKKREFKNEDPISCESIAVGELRMKGLKSNINYIWAGRGDVTEVEYQDLVAAIRSSKSQIYSPSFIIRDEDFLKSYPQVAKIYDSMYTMQDLREIFNMTPSQMKNVILSLPEGAKQSIRNMAASMIEKGTLDSVQKIRILDEIFDTKLMLMTELFN